MWFVIHRYYWPLLHRHPPRPIICSVATLLGTEARKYRSPSYVLDGAATHETVDVSSRSRSLCRDADYCLCQLGNFLLLVGLGDPDPYYAPYTVLPMFFSGVVANIIVALIIGRIDFVYIAGALLAALVLLMVTLTHSHSPSSILVAVGTLVTRCANIYFARVDPRASYQPLASPLPVSS
jgi:hypothetical protein